MHTRIPLFNGIEVVSVLQRIHGEIGCTNSDVQQRVEQTNKTDRQTKNSTFLLAPAAREIRAPPHLAW